MEKLTKGLLNKRQTGVSRAQILYHRFDFLEKHMPPLYLNREMIDVLLVFYYAGSISKTARVLEMTKRKTRFLLLASFTCIQLALLNSDFPFLFISENILRGMSISSGKTISALNTMINKTSCDSIADARLILYWERIQKFGPLPTAIDFLFHVCIKYENILLPV